MKGNEITWNLDINGSTLVDGYCRTANDLEIAGQ